MPPFLERYMELENHSDVNAPSVALNKPEAIPEPREVPPLEGEIPPGASEPTEEGSISIIANEPEPVVEPEPPEPITGEVPPGASGPDMVPPSVVGTPQDPEAAPPEPPVEPPVEPEEK